MLKFIRYKLWPRNGQPAPVEMAPFEILSYIFELACVEGIDWESRPKTISPVTLSHVSTHFRNVAIGTPTLWAVIRVYGLKSAQLDCLETCLERSGTAPLSILLDFARIHSSDPAIAQVISLIEANSCRLQRLTALNKSRSVRSDPLVSFKNDMDNLTKLRLTRVPISWFSCNLGNLVELSLNNYDSHFGLGCHEFWAIIKSSPSLRTLSLSDSDLLPSTAETGIHQPLMLNSLVELQLLAISSDSSLALISRLRAPNLKALILHSTRNDFSGFFDQILGPPMLFPKLVVLLLVSVCLNGEVIGRLQHALSGLRKWQLYDTNPSRVYLYAGNDERGFDGLIVRT